MKKILFACIVALLIGSSVQAQRSVPPKTSFEAYRPLGEIRIWTFMKKDSTIGTLRSVVESRREIDGVDGYLVREALSLDYTKVEGGDVVVTVGGEYYVAPDGSYLGNELTVKVNDQAGKITLERDGDRLTGETVRGDQEDDQELPFVAGRFAIDNDMVDQYELYFAMHGLTEGDVIDDSIFIPRDMRTGRIRGTVVGWTWQELYSNVLDSVFVVRLIEPAQQELFINREFHLRKINIPTQDMRIYLDVVRAQPQVPEPPRQAVSTGSMARLAGVWVLYLIVALLAVALFIGRGYKWRASYLAFVFAMIVTLVVLLIMFRIGRTVDSRSWQIVLYAAIGALQAAVTLGVIYRFAAGSKAYKYPVIGAVAGAAAGLAEAGYLAWQAMGYGGQMFAATSLLLILFQAGSGYLLGWAWTRGRGTFAGMIAALMVLGIGVRLIVPLVADLVLAGLLIGAMSVLVLLWALVMHKRTDYQS